MQRRNIVVLILIIGLGLGAFGGVAWWQLGDIGLPWQGWLALSLGALFTFLVGAGLMALVFYSARRGHDARHHDQSIFRSPEDHGPP